MSGDTIDLEIAITDAADAAYDLTTVTTIKWQLKRTSSGLPYGDPILTKDLDDGVAVTNAVGGLIDISIAPVDTADIFGDFIHEVEVKVAGGAVHTVTTGTFRITKDVIE